MDRCSRVEWAGEGVPPRRGGRGEAAKERAAYRRRSSSAQPLAGLESSFDESSSAIFREDPFRSTSARGEGAVKRVPASSRIFAVLPNSLRIDRATPSRLIFSRDQVNPAAKARSPLFTCPGGDDPNATGGKEWSEIARLSQSESVSEHDHPTGALRVGRERAKGARRVGVAVTRVVLEGEFQSCGLRRGEREWCLVGEGERTHRLTTFSRHRTKQDGEFAHALFAGRVRHRGAAIDEQGQRNARLFAIDPRHPTAQAPIHSDIERAKIVSRSPCSRMSKRSVSGTANVPAWMGGLPSRAR